MCVQRTWFVTSLSGNLNLVKNLRRRQLESWLRRAISETLRRIAKATVHGFGNELDPLNHMNDVVPLSSRETVRVADGQRRRQERVPRSPNHRCSNPHGLLRRLCCPIVAAS